MTIPPGGELAATVAVCAREPVTPATASIVPGREAFCKDFEFAIGVTKHTTRSIATRRCYNSDSL